MNKPEKNTMNIHEEEEPLEHLQDRSYMCYVVYIWYFQKKVLQQLFYLVL